MTVRRCSSPAQQERDAFLLPQIAALKREHPFWGYRRVWATLRFHHGLVVNPKRVARLMRLHDLTVRRATLKAKRTPPKSKPRATRPRQWWGIDMTKVMTESGWVYIVLIVDWFSKKIVGWDAGYQSRAADWLAAVDMAITAEFPSGTRGQGLHLISDNGCQPTSKRFMQECNILGIAQAFTTYNNPKGNADTERMMRTLKEELLWLEEWRGLDHMRTRLATWVTWFNTNYLHSALGYHTPQYVHLHAETGKPNTPLIAA